MCCVYVLLYVCLCCCAAVASCAMYDQVVRRFAVDALGSASDEELLAYMLQVRLIAQWSVIHATSKPNRLTPFTKAVARVLYCPNP